MRLHTIALGCQMSAADGAEMARPLHRKGYAHAAGPEDADAILISTCTVRQHAEDRALSLIGSLRPWKEADPRRLLIVAGCAAQRLGGFIRGRFPHVDLVVGSKSIEQYPEILEAAMRERGGFDAIAETRAAFPESESFPTGTGSQATAFVTIMRGCNYSCSYCIVPVVRGREFYRPASAVLEEIRERTAAGAKEVTLLGQTVNSYDSAFEGRRVRFADLLRLADRVPGVERIRFMSPHPYYVDEAMLAAMAECASACEALHLPVQSGSDRVLKLMRRNYTRNGFLEKARAARRAVPGIVLSTDIIVGFPSETEEDFEATLSLVEELSPASAYCFKYSPRESTESASRPDDVPREVKEERLARLNERIDSLTREALRSRIGSVVEVLTEQAGFGRTRDAFKVRWEGPSAAGEVVSVRITGTAKRTLLGERDEL